MSLNDNDSFEAPNSCCCLIPVAGGRCADCSCCRDFIDNNLWPISLDPARQIAEVRTLLDLRWGVASWYHILDEHASLTR